MTPKRDKSKTNTNKAPIKLSYQNTKMTKLALTEELELIENLIANYQDGIGITALEAQLKQQHNYVFNRRTLQRRLQKLLEEKRLVTQGESIALVYKAVTQGWQKQASTTNNVIAEPDTYVTVSPEGATIRDLMRQPFIYRKPVGYQHEFLAAYKPNHTFYLPLELRQQLYQLGRTATDERPAGTYARDIFGRLLVDLAWASSKLEGNTYSRLDTQNLIEYGHIAQGKDLVETQMILNHKAAIEMLVDDIDEIGFDAFTFKNLHAVLAQDLMPDELACGRLRQRQVEISGTVFYPLGLTQQIEDCFSSILTKVAAVNCPFEQAFFLMVHLPYLQPFEDVNKRVSRLGANISLFKHNLCPLSFIDVPERAYIEGILGVYELNRIELLRDVFVWAYERSCQRYLAISKTMVEPDPLKIKYRETLIQAVQEVVKNQQLPVKKVVEAIANNYAEPNEVKIFSQLLSTALEQLHEGSVARYRLRRSEYIAWQHALNKAEENSCLN